MKTNGNASSAVDSIPNIIREGKELKNLQNEPVRLALQGQQLNSELEELVMDNYRVFIENLTCSIHLTNKDKKLGDISNELHEKLNSLNQDCMSFRDRVLYFVNMHKRNRKTLQHHMQLVELLEVPQLVDACARNGFYDEALDLANFVNGLEKRHLIVKHFKNDLNTNTATTSSSSSSSSSDNNVVQSIVNDVHITLINLRQQQLNLLMDNTALSNQVHILGTLRKLDNLVIDRQLETARRENDAIKALNEVQHEQLKQHFARVCETRIQMDFLEARSIWLKRCIDKVNSSSSSSSSSSNIVALDPVAQDVDINSLTSRSSSSASGKSYGKAIEIIEVFRDCWYLIVTQFQSLFDNHSTGLHSSTYIISAWISSQVQYLLCELGHIIPAIDDGSSLRVLLEQVIFLSDRMLVVGCDVSSLVIPLFQKCMHTRISYDLKASAAQFKSMIATEKFYSEMKGEQIAPLYIKQDANDTTRNSSSSNSNSSGGDMLIAPNELMCYPPLAYLVNSISRSFNYLRDCPMNVLRDSVFSEVSAIFIDICDFFTSISSDLKARGSKYLKHDSAVSTMDALYSTSILHYLLPYVLYCFDLIFPIGSTTASDAAVGNSSGRKGKTVIDFHIQTLEAAKELLSPASYTVYATLWKKLQMH